MRSVALDCDGDALLVRVDQVGAACHTGDRTCFDADDLGASSVSRKPRREHGIRVGDHARPRLRADLAHASTSSACSPATAGSSRSCAACMGDAETPVGVYRKLAGDRPGTFLLESAEHGGVWSRWSIVGAASRATLTERDGLAHWVGEPPVGRADRPAWPPRRCAAPWRPSPPSRSPGLPPLTGGMVGAITYDAVRRWERVPEHRPRRARAARARP